ncbi:MAG: hypothetical protein CM15mP49_33070 [Actinomycetota bacterium]|nr:MAG: hypothetical protein CM15mP49_33070 [Actinomycetota bacterium]
MPAPIELAGATQTLAGGAFILISCGHHSCMACGDPIPWPKASIMANALSKIGDEKGTVDNCHRDNYATANTLPPGPPDQ